jgi:hypothetical protein
MTDLSFLALPVDSGMAFHTLLCGNYQEIP